MHIGKLLVQGVVNSLGTDAIAAYTAAGRIEGFANSFGDSGAAALSVFIAQNVGGKDQKRAERGFVSGRLLLLALGIISSLTMYLFAQPAMAFMLGTSEAPAPHVY